MPVVKPDVDQILAVVYALLEQRQAAVQVVGLQQHRAWCQQVDALLACSGSLLLPCLGTAAQLHMLVH